MDLLLEVAWNFSHADESGVPGLYLRPGGGDVRFPVNREGSSGRVLSASCHSKGRTLSQGDPGQDPFDSDAEMVSRTHHHKHPREPGDVQTCGVSRGALSHHDGDETAGENLSRKLFCHRSTG